MRKRELPIEITASPIGSLVSAFYILDEKLSYFKVMKKWKKFKKEALLPYFDNLQSLVHYVAVYFDLTEKDDLPIYFVTSFGFPLFTIGIWEDGVLQLYPNTKDAIPFGSIQHPEKVFDLKGNQIFNFRGYEWSLGNSLK